MIISKLIAVFGILFIMFLVWLMSENKSKFPWRVVIWGLILQFILAIFILNVPLGVSIFKWLGKMITNFLNFGKEGANFLFGNMLKEEHFQTFGFQFAIIVTSTIIFFSSFVSVLYHLGIMQRIVFGMAWIMQKTMGVSGIESLSAAGNIFIGQTEAPLMVKHYLSTASRSEINSIMVGGFATIAGSVMAAYVAMGISPSVLITASLISAPGGLLLSKIAIPPSGSGRPLKEIVSVGKSDSKNIIDALSIGASDGMKLSLNIMAMLIAFIALIAILDAALGQIASWLAYAGIDWFPSSLRALLGIVFQPFAYLLDIPANEARTFGSLLGTKVSINEFIAYSDLGEMIRSGTVSVRTARLATFALCGFSNFSSIAIQIGGLAAMAPNKRSELASLGLKAMTIGALANLLTTTIASMLI